MLASSSMQKLWCDDGIGMQGSRSCHSELVLECSVAFCTHIPGNLHLMCKPHVPPLKPRQHSVLGLVLHAAAAHGLTQNLAHSAAQGWRLAALPALSPLAQPREKAKLPLADPPLCIPSCAWPLQ